MTAFEQAWALMKARPEEQLMGMGGEYSGGMTIDPRVMSMAGATPEELGMASLLREGDASFPISGKPTRRNIERAPFTSDRGLTREQRQAAAAAAQQELERRKVEGMSPELLEQQEGAMRDATAQALLADPSVAGRPLAETDLAEGFQSPGERRAATAGLEGAARRQLGGGQKGLRMEASSRTPGQRQNVDPETGEIMERRKVRVKRGSMEGIAAMGRGGKGFKQRSYEALGQNPDKREFKTRQEKMNERMAARAAEMGATYTPPKVETKEPKPFQERFKPGSDAYEARHQQLEDQEELFTQMYGPEMGSRIMQQITENPEPPTFTPRASMQGADQFQGDRPVYRPSTGQFLGPQFDEMGKPKMTSRGAPSMTGITPVDLEEMGRQAMVDGEIDPRILQEYYDKLDAAPVTADERRAVADRLRETAERAITDRQANPNRVRL